MLCSFWGVAAGAVSIGLVSANTLGFQAAKVGNVWGFALEKALRRSERSNIV
jgi:hypothetical protein